MAAGKGGSSPGGASRHGGGSSTAQSSHPAKATHGTHRARGYAPTKTSQALKPGPKAIDFKHGVDQTRVSDYTRTVLNNIRLEAGIPQLLITSTVRTENEQANAMYNLEVQRHTLGQKVAKEAVDIAEQRDALADARRQVSLDERKIERGKTNQEMLKQYANDLHAREVAQKPVKQYETDVKRLNHFIHYKGLGGEVEEIAREGIYGDEPRDQTIAKMVAREKMNFIAVTTHAGRAGLEVVDLHLPEKPADRAKLLKAIKRQLGFGVYRVGYPGGPAQKKRDEFADPNCFHIEIQQPRMVDDPAEINPHPSGAKSA